MTKTEEKIVALVNRLYKSTGAPITTATLASKTKLSRNTITIHLRNLSDKVEKLPYKSGYYALYKPRGG